MGSDASCYNYCGDILSRQALLSTFNTNHSLHYIFHRSRHLLDDFVRELLTPTCQHCGSLQSSPLGLCHICQDELPWQPPGCRICQDQLSEFSVDTCPDCRLNPPDFDLCRAALSYQAQALHSPVPGLIHRAKDLNNFPALHCLANLLSTTFRLHYVETGDSPQALLPVPLHVKRLGERGYNQSLELCKVLRKQHNTPIITKLLDRNTGPAQKTLNRQERKNNEGKMFTLKAPKKLTGIHHIAIIDDVITTGSTVREIATLIRQQTHVRRIDVWGVARSNSLHNE